MKEGSEKEGGNLFSSPTLVILARVGSERDGEGTGYCLQVGR